MTAKDLLLQERVDQILLNIRNAAQQDASPIIEKIKQYLSNTENRKKELIIGVLRELKGLMVISFLGDSNRGTLFRAVFDAIKPQVEPTEAEKIETFRKFNIYPEKALILREILPDLPEFNSQVA